ncbi:hypothetical protein IKE67_08905 [bacterium]|nr:hypothetical protein [bacterium]
MFKKVKVLGFNELGNYAPSNIRYWTKGAIECYKSKFDCLHCKTYYIMESGVCQMKATVLELYKKFGEPKEDVEDKQNGTAYKSRKGSIKPSIRGFKQL